jgi:hypothetical protein
MKRSVLKPGFEGSADRDFTDALVQKQFRVAEFDVSLIGWGGVLCVPGMSGGPPLSLPAVQRQSGFKPSFSCVTMSMCDAGLLVDPLAERKNLRQSQHEVLAA